MGKYRVTAPVSYLSGKKVVRYSRPHNEVVEIDDAVAKKLGDRVEKVGNSDSGESNSGPSADTADTQAANASKGAKGR
jgi:hypothetical protein